MGTVELLVMGGPESEPGKDANRLSNQTALAQVLVAFVLLFKNVLFLGCSNSNVSSTFIYDICRKKFLTIS